VSKEIAENLNAETRFLSNQLVIALKAPVKTWNDTIQQYLELYKVKP
jgi:hypothetical protein